MNKKKKKFSDPTDPQLISVNGIYFATKERAKTIVIGPFFFGLIRLAFANSRFTRFASEDTTGVFVRRL
jgi:hypothetical protein